MIDQARAARALRCAGLLIRRTRLLSDDVRDLWIDLRKSWLLALLAPALHLRVRDLAAILEEHVKLGDVYADLAHDDAPEGE